MLDKLIGKGMYGHVFECIKEDNRISLSNLCVKVISILIKRLHKLMAIFVVQMIKTNKREKEKYYKFYKTIHLTKIL